jgi:DNA-binding response OmpR family regulator
VQHNRSLPILILDDAELFHVSPIIALTANALSGEAERCLAAGMNAHMPKPVSWPALFATIDRLVLQSRQDASTGLRRGPEPAGRHPEPVAFDSFDETCVGELRNSIGDQNTMRLLKLFVVEAHRRFPRNQTLPNFAK